MLNFPLFVPGGIESEHVQVCTSDQHIWTEETIRDRFFWEGKGMASGSIHVAYVEIEKLKDPLRFAYAKSHGGCRSWVEINV